MTRSARRVAAGTAVVVGVFAAVLYFRELEGPLSSAETELVSEARTVQASDGRDRDGRAYPLFWHQGGDRWLAPIPVYAGAIAVKMSGSESGARYAAAAFGTLGVLLFYRLLYRTFHDVRLSLVGSVLLTLSPAYVAFSRMATHDGIWLVPITIAWLLSLAAVLERPRGEGTRHVITGAAAAVACVYCQPSGALTMVLIGALSGAVLWARNRLTSRDIAIALATSGLIGLPLVWWLARYPETYTNTLGAWLLNAAYIRNPPALLYPLTSWITLADVSKTYWDFFSPSHLFLSDQPPAFAGVYALPVGLLLVVGARDVLRNFEDGALAHVVACVALLGLIGIPLIAALFREPRHIDRALAIVPLGILLATNGISVLWSRGPRSRTLVVVTVTAVVVQSLTWYSGFATR